MPVVVLDPRGDPGPGRCPGGEMLERAQLELQGGVPGLDDRVVQCALVPETACEVFNRFLDRGLVVGTLTEPEIGFFKVTRAFGGAAHLC